MYTDLRYILSHMVEKPKTIENTSLKSAKQV